MKPETLEAIEAARDGVALLLREDGPVAESITLHLRCVADYLRRKPQIETARKLLTLDPRGEDAWHYSDGEVGDGPIRLVFHSLPSVNALAPLLRVAAQAGYRRQGEVEINRELLTVTWKLQDLSGTVRFIVLGNLDSSKVACQRVQIGTEEVPVYEVQCDQASEADFAALNSENAA